MGVSVTDTALMKNFLLLCNDGWAQGWHERNGGNVSVRLTEEEVIDLNPFFERDASAWRELEVVVPILSGSLFLLTASGAYLNAVSSNLQTWAGIIEIGRAGTAYRVVWGFSNNTRPTSELPSHLLIHEAAAKRTGSSGFPDERVVYHCHPASIAALASVLPMDSEIVSKALWKVHTECSLVFPDGVGALGIMVPGSVELGRATAHLMEHHRAIIWAYHGLLVCGHTCRDAFGFAHVVAKAADIFGRACAMAGGYDKAHFMSDEELARIAEGLGVKLCSEWGE